MNPAISQKRTETAFWPRRIFSGPMSEKTGGRRFANGKNRFANGSCGVAAGNLKPEAGNLKKLRLEWLSLRLRFKRVSMPSKFNPTNPAVTGRRVKNQKECAA